MSHPLKIAILMHKIPCLNPRLDRKNDSKNKGAPCLWVEKHLAGRHLTDSHLTDRHLADRHLADRHLADRHHSITGMFAKNCGTIDVLVKYCFGQMSVGQISIGQMCVGQTFVSQMTSG